MVEMIETEINGRWTLKLPKHRAERPEWKTGWEVERLDDIANHFLGRKGLILDIGGEEMDMSGLYASWGLDVAIIEPNCAVWPNGLAIFRANNLPDPVATYVGFAADETSSQFDLKPKRNVWPACALGPVISDHGFKELHDSPDIPRVTVDDFCSINSLIPDAITIDVEGSEWHVLKGAEQTLIKYAPTVWVSVHHCMLQLNWDLSAAHVYQFMREVGYRQTLLADGHELHVRFDPR